MLEYWYLPLTIALPLFFLWTLVHESAHALQVLFLRGKIIEFKPYPCKINGKWKFGYIKYEVLNLTDLDRTEIAFAPYLVDGATSAILAVTIAGGICPWSRVLLLTIMLAPLLNTGNQARLAIQKKKGDITKDGEKGLPFLLTATQLCVYVAGVISASMQ